MSSVTAIEPLLHSCYGRERPWCRPKTKLFLRRNRLNCSSKSVSNGGRLCCRFKKLQRIKATSSTADAALVETPESADVFFKETFPLRRTELLEGKIFVRLEKGKDKKKLQLSVGCNLPGKWILHWGVSYIHDSGSEWDQPPENMRPPGSVPIRDYAMETPMKKKSEKDTFHQVNIGFDLKSDISAINFVLKDEETGAWYQHRGRDFKVPLVDYLEDGDNVIGTKSAFGFWPGALGLLSNILLKKEASHSKVHDSVEAGEPKQDKKHLEGFYEEQPIAKEVVFRNSVTVSVRKCPETAKNLLYLETDLPEDVVVHWGVCRGDTKKWEVPAAPYPPETFLFKNKALRTLLQQKEGGNGRLGLFTLDDEFVGFLFVLKLNENTWFNCKGNDFYIPLSRQVGSENATTPKKIEEANQEVSQTKKQTAYTDGIINDIRTLVSDISSEMSRRTKTREAQENILQEIEKLAAEAYSIFRRSVPTFSEEAVLEPEALKPSVMISPGTGTGFEILCQGFNWESHKSGRWYMELKEKAAELSSLGFTVIWLPPPTESVSPEGYMPKDLYNLNSRYGNIDELKEIVMKFHEVGIKVLGDVVLNHRCAHKQNQNGVWNIFGGRLNWDDRAIVADDPHFQGRGNKSSGDNFHAAPNIDHSQDFVRKDIKEWLCWLRTEIGYDGWRLDFVRGFWGGYVKDYLDASEPYFVVGEYWDSLNYTFGEMNHNQDAHRQRIVDWINATNGAAGAFDVTTKGILHAALERCEYWRLSDQKGKPPGVVGWWPSRAVTFIENHDTGSTQGHWRFPGGKEMQGYAYILTHPGTPSVFYDHIFSHYRSEIAALLSLRTRKKIHCRSNIQITKAERDVYAAIIDKRVAVKIGPGHYDPPGGPQNWSSVLEGRDYKVLVFSLAVAAFLPALHAEHEPKMDEYWKARAKEAFNEAKRAYHPKPEEVTESVNQKVGQFISSLSGNNGTRRHLLNKHDEPCKATNPIDQCWRCDKNWAKNRKKLAGCAIGFGRNTVGGKHGKFYIVNDTSDDVMDPKPGTLRHAVIQPKPLWITFARSMIITLKEELMVTCNKTIDGRGSNVHIAFGAGITLHYVQNVIIHNIHIHDIVSGAGGMIRDSVDHIGLRTESDGDGISLFGASNVWIDHASMYKCTDGLIDAIMGSTAITISNSHFTDHNDVMLFGANENHVQDKFMQITVAFNHFGKGLVQRMPRCRLGFIHVVNNDYTHWLMYAIGGSGNPTIISQGNRFIAPPNLSAKEVTKREYCPESEWSKWTWRSEGDLLLNGAIFVQSGNPNYNPKVKEGLITAQPGRMVTSITRYAGTLRCKKGFPC